jgi:Cu+-exporting ATPase
MAPREEATMERDPVCGMQLTPGHEEAEAKYQDRTYHFCSRECRDLFVQNPEEYLKAKTDLA